ncbi:signal peptidase II [bacterium]|nr:signal peptidase II [bacterium]
MKKLLPVVALTFLADQATKILIKETMAVGRSIRLLGDFFKLTHVENTGIAFGIKIAHPFVFTLLSGAACVVIVYYLLSHRDEEPGTRMAMAVILGGALGNLLDRILFGKVVDFLDFGFGRTRWPVFNLADTAVVVGMALLFYCSFRQSKRAGSQEQHAETG